MAFVTGTIADKKFLYVGNGKKSRSLFFQFSLYYISLINHKLLISFCTTFLNLHETNRFCTALLSVFFN